VACSEAQFAYFTALSIRVKTRSQERRSNSTVPNVELSSPTEKLNFLSVASRLRARLIETDERVNMDRLGVLWDASGIQQYSDVTSGSRP
jgi:hypothetical protein